MNADELNDFVASLFIPSEEQVDVKVTLTGIPKYDHKETKCLLNDQLGTFLTNHESMDGFGQCSQRYISSCLSKKVNQRKRNICLSSPATRNKQIVVGATDNKSLDHYLLLLNSELLQIKDTDPILSLCKINEYPRNPIWLNDKLLLVSALSGNLHLFTLNEKNELNHTVTIKGVHSSEIRELAVCPEMQLSNIVASTGANRQLCITDIETSSLLVQSKLDGVGSSLRWSHGFDCDLGLTLDFGYLLYYDVRAGLQKPSLSFDMKHKELYAHARYSQNCALLGYGNGDIQNVDWRTGKVIDCVEDPFCQCIGMIEWCSKNKSFVVSGISDFTVWQQVSNGPAKIHSHCKNEPGINPDVNTIFYAEWFSSDEIIATTNQGTIGFWEQDFDCK